MGWIQAPSKRRSKQYLVSIQEICHNTITCKITTRSQSVLNLGAVSVKRTRFGTAIQLKAVQVHLRITFNM